MKSKTILSILGLVLLVVALVLSQVTTAAQSGDIYDLTWSTVTGGVGTSTGGVYSLSGTAGQAEVGTLANGGYTLHGGFWVGSSGKYSTYLPLVLKN